MSKKNNGTGWVLRKDGWHKTGSGRNHLTSQVFSKPIPPVRDGQTGHPIGRDGQVDWARVIREVNERDGHHG
jgi:hypothetical protein